VGYGWKMYLMHIMGSGICDSTSNLVAKLVLGLLHEAKDESTENRL
jgi:hypothetical protein